MRLLIFYVYFITFLSTQIEAKVLELDESAQNYNEYFHNLRLLLTKILHGTEVKTCVAILTDHFYYNLFESEIFRGAQQSLPFFIMKIGDLEDLLAPHFQTTQVLKQIRKSNCDLQLVTVLNGLQAKRFLQFIVKYRVLNTQKKFVLLHDARLFDEDMINVWRSILSVVFLKRKLNNSFSMSTIAYPGILSGTLALKQLGNWSPGKRIHTKKLFQDKAGNLKGVTLAIAIFEHVPMVQWNAAIKSFQGVEIEIVNALADVLNFSPVYYKAIDSDTERWGRPLPNGSHTGLIGQVTSHTANIAIGDLHLFETYFEHIELSWPHNFECLTFLTPESSTDNSWQTLIIPFSTGMWAGVLLSLFFVGTLFYIISFLNSILMSAPNTKSTSFFRLLRRKTPKSKFKLEDFRNVRFRNYLNRYRSTQRRDIFDSYDNCILYTYSMLLYVSLPRMPRNWPLRVMTGSYWIYCILLTVTYRASFTAILANPVARITIDTLEDLVASHVKPIAWGIESKQIFEESFDKILRKVGANMEIIESNEHVTTLIAKGAHAYYDNMYYLRFLRAQDNERRGGTDVLHIMRDCVVNMPVALGLEKLSPLKPHIDNNIRRLAEGGLTYKWLRDAIAHLPAEEQKPQEALMDLSKFWSSFVVLAIGYFLGACALLAEQLHFKYVVHRHPLYNVLNPKIYYNFKKCFPEG